MFAECLRILIEREEEEEESYMLIWIWEKKDLRHKQWRVYQGTETGTETSRNGDQ
jgi:hypothetical protein